MFINGLSDPLHACTHCTRDAVAQVGISHEVREITQKVHHLDLQLTWGKFWDMGMSLNSSIDV